MRQRHLRGGGAFSRSGVWALGLSGLLAVLGAGCGKHEGASAQDAKAPVAELPMVQASTVVVGEAAVPRFLTLTGSLTAFEDSDVAAGAAGKVLSVHVERGSLVKKGDVLVRLDARAASAGAAEARAQMELARTQKELAEADCARNQKLFDGGSVSAADHQRAQAQCRNAAATAAAAEARLSLIENNLADTTIRAPFDGLVAERAVAVGEFVRQDSRVVTLLATDPLRLEITVPEASATGVQKNQEVEFTLTADPGTVHRTTVTYVGPALRRGTRDLVVEALVPNPGHKLIPGQFATAKLRLGDVALPVIPRTAVRTEGSESRIFVASEGKLEERLVQLGEAVGTTVGVLSGVRPGERVVATASADLRDGVKLQ